MQKRPRLKAIERHPALVSIETAQPISEAPKQQPSRIGKKVVTVYLSESVWREVKILAARTDNTIDGLMRRGLDLVLAELRANRGAVEG